MAFKDFRRTDTQRRVDTPAISIRNDTIAFNSALRKLAELDRYGRVRVKIDDDNFKLGFIFHNLSEQEDEHSLACYYDGANKGSKAMSGVRLMKIHKWIKAISLLPDAMDRKFSVHKDEIQKSMWVATLCPSFENMVQDTTDLGNTNGIYRYVKSDGEIVYIGKGRIKSRISTPERAEWIFDKIEYSRLEDTNLQTKWESFWLEKFEREHGRLPLYNTIRAPKGS